LNRHYYRKCPAASSPKTQSARGSKIVRGVDVERKALPPNDPRSAARRLAMAVKAAGPKGKTEISRVR
jgi:hypothetical protein